MWSYQDVFEFHFMALSLLFCKRTLYMDIGHFIKSNLVQPYSPIPSTPHHVHFSLACERSWQVIKHFENPSSPGNDVCVVLNMSEIQVLNY